MADAAAGTMTIDAFLAWQDRQELKYEIVRGIPELTTISRIGATVRHDRVKVAAIVALYGQLRDTTRHVATGSIVVRTGVATLRRPDLSIVSNASTIDGVADEPKVVVEVVCPASLRIAEFQKLNEYQRTAGIEVVILVDTEKPLAIVYRRATAAWTIAEVSGLDGVVEIPEVGARLPLADLYDGLLFAAADAAAG